MTHAEQMIAAARRLAALGLAVHWLRGPKAGGKAPIAKEWQRAPYAPPEKVDEGYRVGCNLGVHTGLVEGAPVPVVVVDLDNPEALAWARDHLPPTPWRTCTRAGEREHWYYRHPGRGTDLRNKAKVGKLAIDIRGDGGNVVVAPSVHPEGHVYAEVAPWEAGAELPVFSAVWFPQEAAPPRAAARKAPPRHRDPDLVRRRARAYLSAMEPAVSGQRGHDRTLAAAAALVRGFALEEGEAFELLRQEYNPRCAPPWSDRDLERKVREAAKLSRLPADGWLRDAERPPPPRRAAGAGEEGALPTWWPAVPDEVREQDPACPPARPQILVSTKIHQMRDEAVQALAAGAPLYQRGGALADIVGDPPSIRAVGPGHLRALLSQAAEWQRYDPRGGGWVPAVPPREVVAAVLERGAWPELRQLRAVVEAPALRPDGTILAAPGYDEATGLYLAPGTAVPEVPEQPTAADVRGAIELLFEVVADFPFAQGPGKSAWLASVLTMLARHAIEGASPGTVGPVPLFLVDANTRGSGKTLLADAAHAIVYGRELEKSAQAKDAEEEEKRLVALALAGVPVVCFDNLSKPLGNGTLDLAITAGIVRGRVLGKSEAPRAQLAVTWFATGNNVRLRADMVRRSLRIRLVCPEDQPEQRQGFRHAPLLPWVRQHRGALLRAALVLLRAYCAAGRPAQPMAPMGSFEAWSELIRGCLLWCDQEDPLLCNDADHMDADDEAAALPDLIEGWAELCTQVGGWCSTAEAVRRLSARADGRWTYPLPRLRDALAELFGPEVPGVQRLGSLLKRYRDRPVEGRALTPHRDQSARGWKVISTQAPSPST